MIYTVLFFGAAGAGFAGELTNKEFLELPEAHQKFWIQGAMLAMGQVAAQDSTKKGKCIIDWYFGEQNADVNGVIIGSMNKYPTYPPSVIFVFLAEQECGAFYN